MKRFKFKMKITVIKSCEVFASDIEEAKKKMHKGFFQYGEITDHSIEIESIKEVENDE